MAKTRTTKVSLIAEVNGYLNGMAQASKATREVGSEAEKLAQKGKDLEVLGQGFFAMGAVAAASVTLAVAKFAEFDQAISEVKASTQESAENMALLREAALDFGASSVFTATQAANAIEELGKAGLTTTDILNGGLSGALSLASAGGLEIARAAEISATTLQQFNLEGDQAGRVADVLAAGAGKALGSVDDLANGLKFVGPVAESMGVSLEETTGVLAAFAQAGIVGEQGGTSLRGMLSSLTSPSKQAAGEIERLGIQLYDAEGNFLGLENAAGQLSGAYTRMTGEQRDASLGMLFGNETVTAARVLYQQGAEGVAKWTEAVDDSGYAAQVARDRLDNLRGDVEKLGGAFDTVLIQSGSAANETLRQLVQGATFMVDVFGEAPQPVQNAALAIGAVTAAAGLATGAFILGAPKIAEFNTALQVMGPRAQAVGTALNKAGNVLAGPWGLALGVGIGAVAAFAAEQAAARARVDAMNSTLNEQTGALTDASGAMVDTALSAKGLASAFQPFAEFGSDWEPFPDAFAMEFDSAYEAADKLGISLELVRQAALEGGTAYEELNTQLDAFNGNLPDGTNVDTIQSIRIAVDEQREAVEKATAARRLEIEATKASVDPAETAADAYMAEAETVTNLASELGGLVDQINAANGINQDAISANASYQEALAGVSEEVKRQREEYEAANGSLAGFNLSLDQNTQSGASNAASLSSVAQAAQEAAEAQFAADQQTMSADGATSAYIETLNRQRDAFINSATQAGYNADEVHALAEEVFALPDEEEIKIIADTAAARGAIDSFISQYTGNTISLRVDGTPVINGVPQVGRADGGPIVGRGGPREDNIPIMASNGEHMLDAEDVRRMGGHAGVYAFRESLYSGSAPRYTDLNIQSSRERYDRPSFMAAPPQMEVRVVNAEKAPASGRQAPSLTIGSISVKDDSAVIRAIERSQRDAMDEFATRLEV